MAEYKIPTSQKELEESFKQIKPDMNATMAYYESARCLYCFDAPCVQACPTSIDIPLFIRQIHTDNIKGAAKTIYASNYFANTCGKVCPTEVLCEGACVYNNQEVKPIEIVWVRAPPLKNLTPLRISPLVIPVALKTMLEPGAKSSVV